MKVPSAVHAWRHFVGGTLNSCVTNCRQLFNVFDPSLAGLGEDGLEVAFKEGAGVLEVLFGVGFGGGDAFKRFVEDADDGAACSGSGWERELETPIHVCMHVQRVGNVAPVMFHELQRSTMTATR